VLEALSVYLADLFVVNDTDTALHRSSSHVCCDPIRGRLDSFVVAGTIDVVLYVDGGRWNTHADACPVYFTRPW
jgi:hypothetical protein